MKISFTESNKNYRKSLMRERIKLFRKSIPLYILFFPVIIYFVIFEFTPMYGLIIAFKNYIPSKGIFGSQWIGFRNFQMFFSSYDFWRLIRNTFSISVYFLFAGTPVAIILALMMNELGSLKLKKLAQTVTYAPHFISTVIISGVIVTFLAPSTGMVNNVIRLLGGEGIDFLCNPQYFKHVYVWSGVWQNSGWASIIYIAALSSVDTSLYESAKIDGCSRLNKIWYIDIPAIFPTIITLLILNVGRVTNVGYQKILLLQNPLNTSTSDVLQTYVYRVGLTMGQFDFATAVGLFNNIINIILLLSANKLARRLSETSLW